MTKKYEIEIEIDAPREVVWEVLTDAAGYAEWNDAVVELDGTIALGEKLSLVSVVDPKRAFKLKVTDFEPPHRWVGKGGMPLGLFTGQREYRVEENGEGSTFSMVEEFSGPMSGPITKAMPDLTESFQLFADSLKREAERRAI